MKRAFFLDLNIRISYIFIIIYCVSANASQLKLQLEESDNEKQSSVYFDFFIKRYTFPFKTQGGGGAILIENNEMVYASADGNFFKIDLHTWICNKEYLPKIYLGQDQVKSSKRYIYQELLPRVHDIYFYHNYYYVSYDKYDSSKDSIVFCIARIKKKSNWQVIYESVPLDVSYYTKGSGGKIVAKDNKIFFTVGDYSLDRINKLPSDIAPQNKKYPFGKINYIDLTDNSYHLYSLGHRNPLGLLILHDGKIISSENGPQGGDELNIITKGSNYGWPYVSFGTVYGSYKEYRDSLVLPTKIKNYTSPLYSFLPSVAPTSLIQLENFDRHWDGDIALASLKAMSIFHMKLTDGRIVFSEPVYIGYRIRDIKQSGDKIIMLNDDGEILELIKKPKTD